MSSFNHEVFHFGRLSIFCENSNQDDLAIQEELDYQLGRIDAMNEVEGNDTSLEIFRRWGKWKESIIGNR